MYYNYGVGKGKSSLKGALQMNSGSRQKMVFCMMGEEEIFFY